MEQRKLGTQGLSVSALGLGCMGMSAFYGATDEAESIAETTIKATTIVARAPVSGEVPPGQLAPNRAAKSPVPHQW